MQLKPELTATLTGASQELIEKFNRKMKESLVFTEEEMENEPSLNDAREAWQNVSFLGPNPSYEDWIEAVAKAIKCGDEYSRGFNNGSS